ncbi:hypothetical protein V5799_020243 [Amblyomma americanum]|uniref:TTF-type domain-containing protein n=1 Tax=Amblyomma americanum TaxID=6943 RepID=A0AAQ4EUC3_AMBAM
MPLPRKMPGSQKKIDNFFVPAQKRLCLGIEGSQAGNDSHESQPADRAIGATSINENPAEVVLDGEPSFTTDLDRTTSNSGACAPVETARRDDSPQDVPSLPPKGYKFPSNQTGRSCKYAWFQKFTWLSYDYERDVVFCTVCLIAFKERGGNVAGVEPCFIRAGFNNWKKAIEKFQCHEKSQFHCVSASRQLSREKGMHVVQLLSQHSSRQQEEARQALRAIVSSVRYLCRTGQALQGQTKDDGNLLDLLDERSQDVPALKRWMEQRDG